MLNSTKNLLLRQLSADDRGRLGRHFSEQRLDFKQTLIEERKPVKDVYFVESGVVSLVTDLEGGESVETGTVGNEGFVGVPAVLGVSRSPGRAFCQIPGHAYRISAEVIGGERQRGGPWFELLLRYVHFVAAMTAQSAACNRMHPVEARLSRWLLMTHDRVDENGFPLTQEFLAAMLGVTRPTVNIAGATLQRAGFITYTRGRITVLDRPGLESASCECYWRIHEELELALNGGPAGRAGKGRRRNNRK